MLLFNCRLRPLKASRYRIRCVHFLIDRGAIVRNEEKDEGCHAADKAARACMVAMNCWGISDSAHRPMKQRQIGEGHWTGWLWRAKSERRSHSALGVGWHRCACDKVGMGRSLRDLHHWDGVDAETLGGPVMGRKYVWRVLQSCVMQVDE